MQDGNRDSSDEEWDLAYAAMDPLAHLRMGSPRAAIDGAAHELLRDVFVAADAVHEDAMSEMGGNTNSNVHNSPNDNGVNMDHGGDDHTSPMTSGNTSPQSPEDDDLVGEPRVQGLL